MTPARLPYVGDPVGTHFFLPTQHGLETFQREIPEMARRTSSSSSGMGFGSLVKTGFGLGIGSLLAGIIFVAIGMGFFFTGFVIYKREAKKKPADQRAGTKVFGIVLMALGTLLGLGFGATVLLDSIGDMV